MRLLIGPLGVDAGTYEVALGSENPGIGGTEHVSLQLAVRLAAQSGIDVEVAVFGDTTSILGPDGPIRTVDVGRTPLDGDYDACLVPVWRARDMVNHLTRSTCRRLIAWSHHPHDRELVRLCSDGIPDAVVSVGGYQYYSNRTGKVEHHWIPNPYPYWAERLPPPMDERETTLGHMGALVKAKGFHRIARHWDKAVRQVPDARLEVVGSGGLYGAMPLVDSEIPAEPLYARRIRAAFGPDGVPPSVHFLGLVPSKLEAMGRWKYGLQSMTGGSEAMPAGVQELIVHGVPVIGSRNFGMWDFMADFPELSVRKPSDYPRLLARVEGSPNLAAELLERCATVAAKWRSFDEQSLVSAWLQVLDGRSKGQVRPASPPLPTQDTSLRWRARYTQVLESTRWTAHGLIDPIAARWGNLQGGHARDS